MPNYSIKDTNTDDIFEVSLKYSELESYLANNPHFKQVFVKFPATADPTRVGVKRPDDGFRDVLKEVKSHHKRNVINDW